MSVKPMTSPRKDHEAEDGVEDHGEDSQDRVPLVCKDSRTNAASTQPFYKVAFSFLALALLHVLLALSFKLAQRGSNAQYAFSSAALLVVAEFLKFIISFTLLWQEHCCIKSRETVDSENQTRTTGSSSLGHTLERFKAELSFLLLRRTLVLAALYCVNNNIAFFVFRLADGANINLIKSGRSFLSALMLRFSLGRSISRVQWSAIFLQIFGLIVAQFGATCTDRPILPGYAYILLFISLLISSLCGVWNDHILKDGSRNTSMHTINILLYSFGFIFNSATYICIADPSKYFFSGFQRTSTYLVLLCQSLFGVAVSAVYKFSDATVKTFALSCATSILMFINIVAFGAHFSLVATMGCLTVFAATHLYVSNPPGVKGLAVSTG